MAAARGSVKKVKRKRYVEHDASSWLKKCAAVRGGEGGNVGQSGGDIGGRRS